MNPAIEQVVEQISIIQEEITYSSRELRCTLSRNEYAKWLQDRENAIQSLLSVNGWTQETYEGYMGKYV